MTITQGYRTVQEVATGTQRTTGPGLDELPAPRYTDLGNTTDVAMMVESMYRHSTDEGGQLASAFRSGGYHLSGLGFDGEVDVLRVLRNYAPRTLVLQDVREFTGRTAGPGFDYRESFVNVDSLLSRDVFKLTVLKDAHSTPDYPFHRDIAERVGVSAWVTYYHPRIVKAQAPFVRERHLVRTYHSIDKDVLLPFSPASGRKECILSGALSRAYPLRLRLAQACKLGELPEADYLQHPGYGRSGSHTPLFLREHLPRYKVSICTSSMYGYAVRKLVESTACGCRVITDLPIDDVLPSIDGNLFRVRSDISVQEMREVVSGLVRTYDEDRQRIYADRAKEVYDYRSLGVRLAADIEKLRREYNS